MEHKKVYQRIVILSIVTVLSLAILNWTSNSESESVQELSGFVMGVAVASSIGVIGFIIYAMVKRV